MTRNKTIRLNDNKIEQYLKSLNKNYINYKNQLFNNDLFNIVFDNEIFDLVILDPPYNLNKKFNDFNFRESSVDDYKNYLIKILKHIYPFIKQNGTVYLCSDWKSSLSIPDAVKGMFHIQNRITWERDKGRGSKKNWKNNIEDIWYLTKSIDFTFNPLKLRRPVIAPYKDNNVAKDWDESNMTRDTCMSNIWTDITIPFWSMAENTEHPTQKPEKLIAKLILASSNENDNVFDPFSGSGTTLVTAKKLKRNFTGIEIDKNYCAISLHRLKNCNDIIQGYQNNIFLSRNMKN